MKLLSTIFMFFILLVSSLALVSSTSQVIFNEIEVNDVSVTDGGIVVIDRGDDLDIRVEVRSSVDYDDVRVKASIEGYEHDDIDDSTEIFDMEGSTGIYTKKLHLEVPSDIDVGDYSLNIEVVNPLGLNNMLGIVLQVREGRHNLEIQDVILRPSYSVEAGRPLGVEVRVENMGSRKEEDIKITASIPALGVSARDYINELGYEERNSDDDETSDSVTLYLPIPVDAVSGEYDLHVNVEYNRDHDVVSTKTKVYVEGGSVVSDIDTIISIDEISKAVNKENVVIYRLMLANLGQDEAIYSLDVAGTNYWADVSFDPGFVRVAPGGAGELNLVLKPKNVATIGDHSFTLKIKENDKTLRDITLTAVVGGKSSTSFKNILEIGFAVLITLLVILGLIVAFKKLQERNEGSSEPEPMMENNQSYY